MLDSPPAHILEVSGSESEMLCHSMVPQENLAIYLINNNSISDPFKDDVLNRWKSAGDAEREVNRRYQQMERERIAKQQAEEKKLEESLSYIRVLLQGAMTILMSVTGAFFALWRKKKKKRGQAAAEEAPPNIHSLDK